MNPTRSLTAARASDFMPDLKALFGRDLSEFVVNIGIERSPVKIHLLAADQVSNCRFTNCKVRANALTM